MLSQDSCTLLHISLLPGVRSDSCARLQEVFGNDLSQLYVLDAHEVHQRAHVSLSLAQKVVDGLADTDILNKELELISKHKINVVTRADADYPELLRHIHVPPTVLYYRGSLEALSSTLAFVGSRKADDYGFQVINSLIPPVVEQGFSTVSGGALGADGMIHRATIQAGGKTIAILGSGLLEPYPWSHRGLFEEIVHSGGMLMSSFSLLTKPLSFHFPARNRIIAGLSRATIVIQAAVKSGALLTARYSLDEGRDVGIVPGSIFNEFSAGCHELLTQGAHPIIHAGDIFDMIGHANDSTVVRSSIKKPKQEKPADPLLVLCARVPQSNDELLIKSGFSNEMLQDRLWQLQIEGRIEQNMLGMWRSLE